jgi:hypothetical protein
MSHLTYIYHSENTEPPAEIIEGPSVALVSTSMSEVFSAAMIMMQPRMSVSVILLIPCVHDAMLLERLILQAQAE